MNQVFHNKKQATENKEKTCIVYPKAEHQRQVRKNDLNR